VSLQAPAEWTEANQASLVRAFARIRRLLEAHMAGTPPDGELTAPHRPGAATTLGTLSAAFGLSTFETDIVTLCAGVDMDSALAVLCGQAGGGSSPHQPTLSLALAALPHAHWSALSPAGPLRRWRLIELQEGGSLVLRLLRIDERILHFLAGLDCLDEGLATLASAAARPGRLLPSHASLAARLAAAWSLERAEMPVLVICGSDPGTRLAVTAEASARVGLELWVIPAELLGAAPAELTLLARLWEREAWLDRRALLVECADLGSSEPGWAAVQRLADRLRAPLILSGRELPFLAGRPSRTFRVEQPGAAEQRAAWQDAISSLPVAPQLADRLASQFSFSASAMSEAVSEVARDDAEKNLWDSCVRRMRPQLTELAQRIEPGAGWDDLVLPAAELATLHQVAANGRHRALVQEKWGFARRSGRGLGVSVLFEGESGTGKTLAAEVIAGDLGLDLYRVDLSQVVNKYIGETEKNLRRVFDAAETGGAVVLFDEADAIFGRRSEVRDSHDRYANIEVGYLLQRMEEYRGIAILTTNLRSSLDPAFLRRLRFVVTFPFPDEHMRERIWRRAFPPAAPVAGLDLAALARLSLTGGSIRNIALQAAFLAAEDGGPATMAHVMAAARTEFQKLGRNLTVSEGAGQQ
jgi:hypothetical protein